MSLCVKKTTEEEVEDDEQEAKKNTADGELNIQEVEEEAKRKRITPIRLRRSTMSLNRLIHRVRSRQPRNRHRRSIR